MAPIRLPPQVMKCGKICAMIVAVYCIYLIADGFLVKFALWERKISPGTSNESSTPNKDENINNFGVRTTSVQSITRTSKTSVMDLKPIPYQYLAPFNTLQDLSTNDNQFITMQKHFGNMFRSAFGLTAFKTEDGQNAWIENGVVLRPIRKYLNRMSNRDDIKPPHPSDFEYYVPFDENQFFQGVKRPSVESVKPKFILWYNPLHYVGGINKPAPLRLCPDFPCQITTNTHYERNSSAMVFEGSLISHDIPKRNPEQVFVFHHTETPLSAGYLNNSWLSKQEWRRAFNWTMSFRLDSDIPAPYGLLRKRPEPLEKNYTNLVARKTKMAATIMSHCNTNSKREMYIKKLQEYIAVDIFGKCGKKCMRSSDSQCAELISSQYKFYLAVENSLCDDYVTEKFFRFLSYDFVVVARGGSGYFKHAPPEIFINTADFKSPEELAQHLMYLDHHPEEYEAILQEKNKYVSMYEAYYRVSNGRVKYVHYHYEAVPFCRICHWLWTLDSHRKTIPDIKAWMLNTTCIKPTDFLKT